MMLVGSGASSNTRGMFMKVFEFSSTVFAFLRYSNSIAIWNPSSASKVMKASTGVVSSLYFSSLRIEIYFSTSRILS